MKMSNLLVLLAALCLLGACKGSPDRYESLNKADSASITTDSINTDSVQSRLVKTAAMEMKVADVQKSCESITHLTRSYHGLVMHHHMKAVTEGSQRIHLNKDSILLVSAFSTAADMTVRIPSDSLEQFVSQVGHMGLRVDVRQMDVEDKTLDYLEASLKQSNRSQIVHQQNTGKLKFEDPTQVVTLKDDITSEKIANKRIDAAVKNSVVDISLYQNNTIMKETIANDDTDNYRISFWSRIGLALSSGLTMFTDVVVLLTNLWLFAIAGGLIWLLVKWYKRKRLPTSPALKI
ncbi:DUF4349 domain-containing protein [Mucilaginibacter robiniae]|uniref:DUF4349 domain-containing protein n=1 Tax=Mucilaginibacter robiniae TaxID=2728022 RepID=A0A7L5DZG8_9SPHI|nr:DUF4349 domain-containing protein [Mucilaginibacter robiniae]QJD95618.1 DUF4349 domain-containing protein [Mucilaginibacter robiniae]